MAKAKPFIKWAGVCRIGRTIEREYTSRTAHRTLYVETTKQTDYGKEGYKYRSKGRNSSYN